MLPGMGAYRWDRNFGPHGKKFYREIRKKRKYYLKGYLTRKTKMRLRKQCERMARKEKGLIAELWKSALTNFPF
jgi:hypothetical protein